MLPQPPTYQYLGLVFGLVLELGLLIGLWLGLWIRLGLANDSLDIAHLKFNRIAVSVRVRVREFSTSVTAVVVSH